MSRPPPNSPFGTINDFPDLQKLAKWALPILFVLFVLGSAKSLYFIIEPSEVGVIQFFGKHVRTATSGLGFKAPWGIETLTRVQTTAAFREEFGFATKTEPVGFRSEYSRGLTYDGSATSQFRLQNNFNFNRNVGFPEDSFLSESLMLTGDLNFAEVTWTIQYNITNPTDYLFNVKNPEETLRNMAESVVREVVGESAIDEVLTYGKEEIQRIAHKELQKILDEFQCGITITQLVFQDVNPPMEVKSAFEDVNKAEQEKNKSINQAWAEYNKVIPRADGQKKKIISEAHGYAINRVNLSKGEAERFITTWNAYKDTKDVTKRRLYLEAMSDVFSNMNKKIIVDSDVKGILPMLDLNAKEKRT
jgi:membrane protease subunit HflK